MSFSHIINFISLLFGEVFEKKDRAIIYMLVRGIFLLFKI